MNSSHSYPSITYATVRHEGGCNLQIENDVIQEHTDKRDLCTQNGQFMEVAQTRSITFFGETETLKYVCSPDLVMAVPGEPAGTTHVGKCADTAGDAATITATDYGPEQVSVGGVTVTVLHVVFNSVLTGGAVGTSHDDFEIVATTGLTVSWSRTVDTVANAAFGAKAHYTEKASFSLISLTPQT